jgi:TctA family transporter
LDLFFDIKTAREMISFAVWNLLGVLAGLGQNVGVNVLLNIYFKPEVSASRALITANI